MLSSFYGFRRIDCNGCSGGDECLQHFNCVSVLVFLCVNRLVGQAFQYGEAWFGLCDGDEVGERLVVDDSRILRTHPLLVNFSMIDEETLRAALGILVIAEQTSLALAMSQHLQARGLIAQGGACTLRKKCKGARVVRQ